MEPRPALPALFAIPTCLAARTSARTEPLLLYLAKNLNYKEKLMKFKQMKKMSLNKSTVANLESTDLNSVKGGTQTGITCTLCDTRMSCLPDRCLYEYSCQPGCDTYYL
jgi:hypothetical protein